MKDLIVITGASNGMGNVFVKEFIKEGKKNILAIDIDSKGLAELKKEYPTVETLEMDLTKKESYKRYEKYLENVSNVKTLVNCAGFGIFDHTENIANEIQQEMIDLNVKAYVQMVNITLPYMNEDAHIVNFASCAGFQPIPYINLYAATKAFVVSYSRALNEELKYRGIHVMAVCPFWTKTNFFNRAVKKDKKEVVIHYAVMYNPVKVVKKAIKDMYKNKELSVYGTLNKTQQILVKLLPHKWVMKIWMSDQKYNGTPEIRD